MTIRLRRDEREQIVALLESDFDSPEDAASAIFSLVAGLLSQRSSYALEVAWAGGVRVGPFHDQRQAKAAGKRAASTFAPDAPEGSVRVIPLAPPASLSDRPTGPEEGTSGCGCGHPPASHLDKRWKRWKKGVRNWDAEPWQVPGCCVIGCDCREVA